MQDFKITKNFWYHEVTHSDNAIMMGISNDVETPEQMANVWNLAVNLLQPLRELLGRPVIVNSWFRNKVVNEEAGGVPDSDHMDGGCADIEVPGMSNRKLYETIKENFKFDQLILEYHDDCEPNSGWVHVGTKLDPSQNRMMAFEEN